MAIVRVHHLPKTVSYSHCTRCTEAAVAAGIAD
jgi:hypothetical protein